MTAKKHVSDAKRGTAPWQSIHSWWTDTWTSAGGGKNISCRVMFAAGTGVQVQTSSSLRFWRRQTSRVTLRALIANDFSYCSLKLRSWYFASWWMLIDKCHSACISHCKILQTRFSIGKATWLAFKGCGMHFRVPSPNHPVRPWGISMFPRLLLRRSTLDSRRHRPWVKA